MPIIIIAVVLLFAVPIGKVVMDKANERASIMTGNARPEPRGIGRYWDNYWQRTAANHEAAKARKEQQRASNERMTAKDRWDASRTLARQKSLHLAGFKNDEMIERAAAIHRMRVAKIREGIDPDTGQPLPINKVPGHLRSLVKDASKRIKAARSEKDSSPRPPIPGVEPAETIEPSTDPSGKPTAGPTVDGIDGAFDSVPKDVLDQVAITPETVKRDTEQTPKPAPSVSEPAPAPASQPTPESAVDSATPVERVTYVRQQPTAEEMRRQVAEDDARKAGHKRGTKDYDVFMLARLKTNGDMAAAEALYAEEQEREQRKRDRWHAENLAEKWGLRDRNGVWRSQFNTFVDEYLKHGDEQAAHRAAMGLEQTQESADESSESPDDQVTAAAEAGPETNATSESALDRTGGNEPVSAEVADRIADIQAVLAQAPVHLNEKGTTMATTGEITNRETARAFLESVKTAIAGVERFREYLESAAANAEAVATACDDNSKLSENAAATAASSKQGANVVNAVKGIGVEFSNFAGAATTMQERNQETAGKINDFITSMHAQIALLSAAIDKQDGVADARQAAGTDNLAHDGALD